ncbi:MAG: hypothetical protein PHQ74_03435 [Crocinitomicaceae bacterium]|nr:hypothetical protein [Crocinitomicaceae bacterium]
MNILFQLALIILPTAAVIFTAVYFLKKQNDIFKYQAEKEMRNVHLELKKERQSYFLPNRVEACQRAVLFLERISPNSLIMRLHNAGYPAKMMQAEFLKAIREEYDHNVAQQIFISPQAWEMVKNSKEETIKIINIAGQQMDETSTAIDLNAKIFELVAEIGVLPTEITIEFLKKELQELF